MIGAVLFDVDGTLVDSNDLHAAAWQQAFSHFGVELSVDEIRAQIGKGGDNLIPALLPAELVERCQAQIEDYRSTLFQRDYLPRAVPFPGIRPLFERLYRDRVRIVLATSAKAAELDFHRNLIGSSDLIFAATSKDDVEHSKPCPDIFAAAIEKVDSVDPGRIVVVGDSPWDVKAAEAAGLRAVALRCGGFPEPALIEAGARLILDDPRDLLARYAMWTDGA
ncbi:HAD family hydrolase [Sphingosinicella terrae]|uniref:HAD family hydrolase n=1 Tax=Sphingosinicella terrae TaxID=2172047 RepID=UPI0025480258|nr:HAD family hydrolase [Sphingosinicella terrae]